MDFRKILAVVLVVACVPHPGAAEPPTCTADGASLVCYDCLTRGDCVKDAPATAGTPCPTGQACKVIEDVATCMPLAEVPQCNCGGANAGCDAYNTDFQIFCIPAGSGKNLYLGANCAMNTPVQTCSEGQCVEAQDDVCTTLGPGPGFFLETTECTSGVFCNEVSEAVFTQACEAGEYFNLAKSACEAYPPNPCAGCTGPKCPIISDCSKYVVCSNGEAADDDESCDEGKFFDPVNQNCEGISENEVCKDYVDCVFESTTTVPPTTTSDSDDSSPDNDTPTVTPTTSAPTTTTTKPPCTSSNANQRYPHETDCKKYYTCREVSRNTFKYVDGTCPTPYVFNPTILKCDLVSKVPACQTSAT